MAKLVKWLTRQIVALVRVGSIPTFRPILKLNPRIRVFIVISIVTKKEGIIMQNHEMRLNKDPFEQIASGKKRIEYRLADEKRRKIEVGDTITFYKRPEEIETLRVRVTELKTYPTLYAMYEDTFDDYLFELYDNPEEVVADTPYYSEEEVQEYGCLAIRFEPID